MMVATTWLANANLSFATNVVESIWSVSAWNNSEDSRKEGEPNSKNEDAEKPKWREMQLKNLVQIVDSKNKEKKRNWGDKESKETVEQIDRIGEENDV